LFFPAQFTGRTAPDNPHKQLAAIAVAGPIS
jgi:hypothetical protein